MTRPLTPALSHDQFGQLLTLQVTNSQSADHTNSEGLFLFFWSQHIPPTDSLNAASNREFDIKYRSFKGRFGLCGCVSRRD